MQHSGPMEAHQIWLVAEKVRATPYAVIRTSGMLSHELRLKFSDRVVAPMEVGLCD